MGRTHDYAVGRIILMQLTDDGMVRMEGHTTYPNYITAKKGADRLAREHPARKITMLTVGATFWLDPKPDLLSDEPQEETAKGA